MILSVWVTAESAAAGSIIAVLWYKRLAKHSWFLSFLNYSANNGGIGLAFALLATLGTNGFLTIILRRIGIRIYPNFDIVSLTGIHFAYLSFLVPYMTILFLPAVGSFKAGMVECSMYSGSRKEKIYTENSRTCSFSLFYGIYNTGISYISGNIRYSTGYFFRQNKSDNDTDRISDADVAVQAGRCLYDFNTFISHNDDIYSYI